MASQAAPAKLPLVARKTIRDDFESKKEATEKQIKDLLGEEYKLDMDFPTLYSQGTSDFEKDKCGKIVQEAVEDLIKKLKDLTKKGEDKTVVDGFNEAITKRSITVLIEKTSKPYSSSRVEDGVYQILFQPGSFGGNSYNANDNMLKEIDIATAKIDPKKLPLIAKIGIKEKWENKNKDEIEAKIKKALNGNDLTCHADYEAIWAKIVDDHSALSENDKSKIDLETCSRNLGLNVKEYFASFPYYASSKIKNDDIIVEAIMEEVTTKQIWFEICDAKDLPKGYSSSKIQDGKLVCFTTSNKFGSNSSDTFQGLENQL